MSHVLVTFKLDVSDPDDHTGLSEHDYDELHEQIPFVLGGYDIETNLVTEETPPAPPKRRKKV